ncbi:uncharacterized protein [Chaetodon trifascialis]|uniref:uncharacterized protein n=1 Tax=Chaetodon trifascialis TaxID=109706 RepID=UPI0039915C3F
MYMQLNPNIPILKVYNNPESCLKRDLRLTRQSVNLLLRIIHSPRDHGWGQELEVLMFLYCLAHGLSLSVVCRAFGVPRSTVHRVIHRIAAEIKGKLGTVISLPSQDMLPDIGMGFCQLARSPVFTRAAGAIDGCHIRIKPPGNQHRMDYINYKLFPSIHLQAISDATGRFLDIFVGYLGSVHYARVLRNSPIFNKSLYPPAGYFLLADGGYPCLEKPIALITPYKLPLQGRMQERFNTHHSRARSVVELNVQKRWRATLFKALEVSPAFAPDIVACCAFLHNLCLHTDDILEMEDIEPAEDHPVPVHVAPDRAETSGNHIRERIAAQLSAPDRLPQHLQEHDYF